MPRGKPRKPRLGRIDAAVDAMAQLGFPEKKVKKVVRQLLKEYGGHEGWQFIEDCAYMELVNAILCEVDEDAVTDGDNVAEDNVADGDNVAEHNIADGDNVAEDNVADGDNNGGNQSEDMSVEDEGAALGTSNLVIQEAVASCLEAGICSPGIHNEVGERVITPPVTSSPEKGNAWKDIVQDQTSKQVVAESDKNKYGTDNVPLRKTQPFQRGNKTPVSPVLANLPLPPPRNTPPASRRTPCYGWLDSDEEEVPKKFICLTPAHEVEKKSSFLDGTECKLQRQSRWDQRHWERY